MNHMFVGQIRLRNMSKQLDQEGRRAMKIHRLYRFTHTDLKWQSLKPKLHPELPAYPRQTT